MTKEEAKIIVDEKIEEIFEEANRILDGMTRSGLVNHVGGREQALPLVISSAVTIVTGIPGARVEQRMLRKDDFGTDYEAEITFPDLPRGSYDA